MEVVFCHFDEKQIKISIQENRYLKKQGLSSGLGLFPPHHPIFLPRCLFWCE